MSLRDLTDAELSHRLSELAKLHRLPAAKADYKRAVQELQRRDRAKGQGLGEPGDLI